MKPEKENTTNSDLFDPDATDENPRFKRADENIADLCELSLEDLSAIVGGDVGTNLFAREKEYVYALSIESDAGSSDSVGFSSAYNITDDIHVQNTGNVLNVKLDNGKFGA